MNEYTNQYLNKLNELMPIEDENTGRFLSEIASIVDEYLEDYPDATYLELVKRFGEPQLLVDSYLGEQDPLKLIQIASSGKKPDSKRLILLGALAVLIIGIIVFVGYHSLRTAVVKDIPSLQVETMPDSISTQSPEDLNTEGE